MTALAFSGFSATIRKFARTGAFADTVVGVPPPPPPLPPQPATSARPNVRMTYRISGHCSRHSCLIAPSNPTPEIDLPRWHHGEGPDHVSGTPSRAGHQDSTGW